MSIKILGYIDLATGKQVKTAKALHNIQDKRKAKLDEKALKAIQQVEANILNRGINELKSKYQTP